MKSPNGFQLSRSALSWMVLCAGIVLALVIATIFISRRRADNLGKNAVHAVGGKVYDVASYRWREDRFDVDLTGTKLTDADLISLAPKLKDMTYVVVLRIDGPSITSRVLPHLRGFPGLRVLDMSGTSIETSELEAFVLEEGIPGIGRGEGEPSSTK